MAGPLNGLRILVVEDEPLCALEMGQMIEDLGGEVVGPIPHLADARRLARQVLIDGAVLDLDLGGETSLPLVDELMERDIPVVLATGQDPSLLPEYLTDTPYLPKPYDGATFREIAQRYLHPR